MPSGFKDLHFHIADKGGARAVVATPMGLRGVARPAPETAPNQEAAARIYLSAMLGGEDQPASMRSLTAPERPELVPDLRLRDTQSLSATGTVRGGGGVGGTTLLRFVQTQKSVPIFGSRATVELDANNDLVSVDAAFAEVKGVSHIPALSAGHALERIADRAGVKSSELQGVDAPELCFFHDEAKDEWHLAYFFRDVPAASKDLIAGLKSHGIGRSPGQRHPRLDYLIDAHDGTTLLSYSSTPTANGDVPVSCEGIDEYDKRQSFFGNAKSKSGGYELYDPMRGIKTYDFGGQDVDSGQLPADPISVKGSKSEFLNLQGAVSAHFHAKRVDDFLRLVLARNGIDNKGMELVSCVNCILLVDGPGPEWKNAVWWQKRMWYGQVQENGRMRSYSRFLDVIAHELAHGITETTANLIYNGQSGALNESFSDIFGVIVNNWDWSKTDMSGGDVGNWDWEIGKGLGAGGLPLRDMQNPATTLDPDHMDKYVTTTADNGGVHTNSNIHNKAAYNVLTAKGAKGQWMFSPRDVAILYYYTLLRLDRLATFKQTLDCLLSVAKTFYSGSPDWRKRLAAIKKAYKAVGIV